MLKSKFKKEDVDGFRATKIFTDRMEPTSVFLNSLDKFVDNKLNSEIICYYGVGGIGKTKLLRELEKKTDNRKTFYSSDLSCVFISLDA